MHIYEETAQRQNITSLYV